MEGMIMPKRMLVLLALAGMLSTPLLAAVEVFPLSQVRRGLTGVGRTCLQGREVVEFQFEVLGVMENVIAGHSVVLVRVSGQGLEKSGIFSGMSGSPVYIGGKLLGAVAYGFPFSTDAIAGVTPFEEMKAALPPPAPGAASRPAAADPAGLDLAPMLASLRAGDSGALPVPNPAPALAPESRLAPIETPLMISGAFPAALEQFQGRFRELGFVPMQGGSAGAAPAAAPRPLQPGSGVVVSLIRGDLNVGAGGTVTEVDGDQVYAFGHPFLNLGSTSLPMHDSEVITVVNNLNSSFKFFTTGAAVGAIRQDRTVGIAGQLQAEPRMIPVEMTIDSSRGGKKTFRFEVARDPVLTPFFLNFGLFSFFQEGERAIGHTTIEIEAEIQLADGKGISLRNVFSQPINAAQQAALYVSLPVQYILASQFPDIEIRRVTVAARVRESLQNARIEEVRASRLRVRPGDAMDFRITLQMQDGTWKYESFPIRIPEEIPPGPLQVFVGDGNSLSQLDQQLEPGLLTVYNSEQLIRVLRNLRQSGTIYVKLFRRGDGLFARGRLFPALPPSYQDIFRTARVQDASTEIRFIHFSEDNLGNKPYVVTGAKTFELTVEPY
jgi:hypothetical protein